MERNDYNRPAGQYNVRAVIQSNAPTQGTDGAMVLGAWGTFKTVWVKVIPRSGKERFLAGKETPELECSVFLRYTPGVTAQMRLLIAGQVYSIEAEPINRGLRGYELELICSMGRNNG